MDTLRTARLAAAALTIPLLLTALSACGPGDDGDTTGQGSGSDGSSANETFEDYQLDFASCMREKGVDMPDPGADGSIEAHAGDGFMEAAQTCQDELGPPPAPPGGGGTKTEEEQRAEWLEIAACLRENGIDVPDPGPGESLTLNLDETPEEVLEECAPEGIGGSTGAGS